MLGHKRELLVWGRVHCSTYCIWCTSRIVWSCGSSYCKMLIEWFVEPYNWLTIDTFSLDVTLVGNFLPDSKFPPMNQHIDLRWTMEWLWHLQFVMPCCYTASDPCASKTVLFNVDGGLAEIGRKHMQEVSPFLLEVCWKEVERWDLFFFLKIDLIYHFWR